MTIIDVSEFQGDINWNVARTHIEAAVIKAFEHQVDPRFVQNWQAAKAAGVKRGAYCFADKNRDPHSQAQDFLNVIGADRGELRCVLDAENPNTTTVGPDANWCVAWLEYVAAKVGYPPVLYTDTGFLAGVLHHDPRLARYGLWIANLNYVPPAQVPTPWPHVLHQFSWTGQIPGIPGNVDLDFAPSGIGPLLAAPAPKPPVTHPGEQMIILAPVTTTTPNRPAFVELDLAGKRLVLYNGAKVRPATGASSGFGVTVIPITLPLPLLGWATRPDGFSVLDTAGEENRFYWAA